MSTHNKDLFSDFLAIFFPPKCPVCGELLSDNEYYICMTCRFMAPVTEFWNAADNPMTRRLEGLLPVERAAALFWFISGSRWQYLIHSFKYYDKWHYARVLGEWLGAEMAESGLYGDVDTVIPVPLHWMRRLWRTYNQSEYIADGIASELGIKVDRRSLVRRVYSRSQARSSADKRWENVDGIFKVRNPEALKGRHILLVDDVFTTGATLVSCGNAILESVGAENVKLSVATIAVTQRSMALDR